MEKEFDILVEQYRRGNFLSNRSVRKLGPIGDKIRTLHNEVTEINKKQALKISALVELKSLLLQNSTLPMVVTDSDGTVTDVGRKWLEQHDTANVRMGERIQELIPGIGILELRQALLRDHSVALETPLRERVNAYPVMNSSGQIANVVFVWGGRGLHIDPASRGTSHGQDEGRRTLNRKNGFLVRLFSRR